MFPITSYQISIVEEDGTETPISYKEYDIELLPITDHEIDINQNGNDIELGTKPNFIIESNQDSFSFLYCVAYRHPSIPEWILARGVWNDEGIWTPDGIWRDD